MTALSASRNTTKFGADVIASLLYVPLAASTKVYQGGIVCLNASGYGVPASSALGLIALGRCIDQLSVDNSSGAAGDKSAKVERGPFAFTNSSSTDALTQADVGKLCYLVDDQTVARTDNQGQRSIAGRVLSVSTTDGVIVEMGVMNADPSVVDIFVAAGADLSSSQYLFVKNSAGSAIVASAAGEDVMGVLQNAPANAAIAIIRVLGKTRVIASGVVAIGSLVATTSAGKTKVAVAGTVNTSDAGAASDPTIGSFVMGRALSVGATDTQHSIVLHPMGLIPTTAA